jgi:hypothetical protein
MEAIGSRMPLEALETRTPKRLVNFALVPDLGVSDLTNGHGKFLHLHPARNADRETEAENPQARGLAWGFCCVRKGCQSDP